MSRKSERKNHPQRSADGSPSSVFLKRALLVLGATAVALGLAEIFCRWNFKKNIASLVFTDSDLYYYNDRDGYRHMIPNKIGYERMWNDQGRAEFRINSLGFRGPEFPMEKPAGTFRILFLGDSITMGGRLPEDVTYVSRVSQALAPLRHPRYEVINAGIGDVGLLEEEQLLHANGIKIRPDLIVLCWYLNDARPPVGFPEEIVYKNSAIRWFNDQPWLRKSYLAGFLYDRLRQSLVSRQLHLADVDSRRFDWIQAYMQGRWARDSGAFQDLTRLARFDWGDAWDDRSLDWMAGKIAGLRDFAQQHGARFAVVMMPVHAQVYAGVDPVLVDKPQRNLGAHLKATRIPYLDLLEVLRPFARKHPNQKIFYDQCHYTPDGNALVAPLMLEFLKKSAEPTAD